MTINAFRRGLKVFYTIKSEVDINKNTYTIHEGMVEDVRDGKVMVWNDAHTELLTFQEWNRFHYSVNKLYFEQLYEGPENWENACLFSDKDAVKEHYNRMYIHQWLNANFSEQAGSMEKILNELSIEQISVMKKCLSDFPVEDLQESNFTFEDPAIW